MSDMETREQRGLQIAAVTKLTPKGACATALAHNGIRRLYRSSWRRLSFASTFCASIMN
jgi:hypothetical protein